MTSPANRGPEVGTTVVHRRYVPYSHAHYAGNLVDDLFKNQNRFAAVRGLVQRTFPTFARSNAPHRV